MTTTATFIPLWVPAILLGLLWLGRRQMRTRLVKPSTQVLVVLGLCGLSLSGVASAFGLGGAVLACWAAGYALGLAGGLRLPGLRGLVAQGELVRVPGSAAPLVLMMLAFAAKFVLGYASAVQLPLLHEAAFAAAMSAALGSLSGAFAARALAVLRCAWGAGMPAVLA